jgi:hypothetical protein
MISAVAAAALVFTGLALSGVFHHPSEPLDANTVALPDRFGSIQATKSYLDGDGAPVTRLLALTANLPSSNTADACHDLAMRLDEIGGPDVLAAAATKSPEPTLRDAALNHVGTVATISPPARTDRISPRSPTMPATPRCCCNG